MTYLTGVQALGYEADLASVPGTVVSQTGEYAALCRWYRDAWIEIQNAHDSNWRWMRHTAKVSTVAGTDTYAYGTLTDQTTLAAITRFKRWIADNDEDPPKIYLTSAGVGTETWLSYMPWDDFKAIYRIGTQNNGFPAHITVDPQNRIVLGPKPNDIYVLTLDYIRSAQVLSADADVPELPTDYHLLIVYRALEKYAFRESAPELLARAEKEAKRMMRQLEKNQLEPLRQCGPLA